MARQGNKGGKGRVNIIRREEHAAEAHHGGAWKVAYADFVTAMMAFFLLMWLLNATTEDQRKGLADYFSPNNMMSHASSGTGQPFGGHTAFDHGALVSDRGSVQVLPGSRPVPPDPADDPDAFAETADGAAGRAESPDPQGRDPQGRAGTSAAPSATPRSGPSPAPTGVNTPTPASVHELAAGLSPPPRAADEAAAEAAQRAEQRRFEHAAEAIRQAVAGDPKLAEMAGQIAVDVTPEGLRIQLLDRERQSMFATGSPAPNEQAKLLIAKIAPVLLRLPGQVSIEGHTDAAPYPGPDRTNWELSAERANAARRMLAEAGLPDQRIRDVMGHADHDLLLPAQPLAPANRRIAITVLRAAETAVPPSTAAPPS